MAGAVDDLVAFAAEIAGEGYTHVVLLGMGGSSLAPEVYQATFGNADGHPELIVLDSTHPDAVADVDAQIDIERTLFIVASKSGTTLETLSFFRYFWQRLVMAGVPQRRNFVALTDPGSTLEDIAAERGFRRVFSTPPEVGGRYSALTYFGLVPAALIGVDVRALLSGAAVASGVCRGPGEDNPGLILGAVWGEAALAGRDKLTLVVSPTLAAFPNWLEQLIAESTGKDGTGIVPIAGEALSAPDAYGDDRLFLAYLLGSEQSDSAALDALEQAGHPVIRVVLDEAEDLGSAMFTAEMATAAAGSLLGIHPFNQPDVQVAKELARKAMAGELAGGAPITEVAPTDADALAGWLASRPDAGYVGIAAYLPMRSATVAALQDLRHGLRALTGQATTVGFGPRFLHSTGQLHKGGPPALFMQIVDAPNGDLPVPETDFSFGRLIAGQAEGDYRALQERHQRVVRVAVGEDEAADLAALIGTVRALG